MRMILPLANALIVLFVGTLLVVTVSCIGLAIDNMPSPLGFEYWIRAYLGMFVLTLVCVRINDWHEEARLMVLRGCE